MEAKTWWLRKNRTVFWGIDGDIDDLGVVVGVSDGDGGVLSPELVERSAEQSVVQPRQGVVPPGAARPGAVVVRVRRVVVGQVEREAAHRQHPRHHQVHRPQLNQALVHSHPVNRR